MIKGKILWIDDEIELLKAHIMYLEKKDYSVTSVSSGEDGIKIFQNNNFDIILLDEMMTGLDGLSTLKKIKAINPLIPIIMITKNEEEWLMEEAIASQISNYLTKPVNPSQILMACKNVLEHQKIQSENTLKDYLNEFQTLGTKIEKAENHRDWYQIANSLSDWTIKFDDVADLNLKDMLEEQKSTANKLFSDFYIKNYLGWLNDGDDSPILSNRVLNKFIRPKLNNDEKVVFIVIDCLRLDQWKEISKYLYPYFNIINNCHYSIIPSATPYSRNAIFSGLFPIQIQQYYPDKWAEMEYDETSMNRFEKEFIINYLSRNDLNKKSLKYSKIITYEEGKKIAKNINDFKNIDLFCLVVNFVDILGHLRAESNLIKEIIPDEHGYRKIVSNWFESSWLFQILKEIKLWGHKIVITSDHGSLRVNKPIKIKGDRTTSTGIRYKHGRNLNINSKHGLKIDNPSEYFLPSSTNSASYLIAKDDLFFLYANNYNRFVKKFKHSFQHGGVSIDEIIVPVGELVGKD